MQRLLERYVREKAEKQEPFFITEEINSSVYGVPPDGGLGFLPFLAALFAGIASIAGPIANIAGGIAAIKAVSGGGSSPAAPNPQATAAALTPEIVAALQARGIMLPSSIAPQIVHAGLLDSLSPANQELFLIAGIGLVALLILK